MVGDEVQIDHARYQTRVREMSTAKLLYIIKDAREAIEAMPDGPKAGYYADEINYCAMELRRRRDAVGALIAIQEKGRQVQ